MVLNISRCSDELRMLLEEVKSILNIQYDENGPVLLPVSRKESGYLAEKQGQEITIEYHSKSDFCRALVTVCQKENEEEFHAEEQSSFEEFGVMLDFSRNAVMRNDAIKHFIRTIALMGYNFLGIYMEDTIEIPEEPYFGYMRGAMTAAQLKELDEYAEIFGMEIRAYIQTLAHLNQITRYDTYQEIIDVNDILLAGEERTYELLENLIRVVSENVSSRKINIGMDEAHMIGLGKYLDQHGYSNRAKIMEEHLKRVLALCNKYGLKVQMWSDMFFRLAFGGEYYVQEDAAVTLPEISQDVELVYWDYYSCDKERYAGMLKNHLKLTQHVGFAGGAWKWMGFTPNNSYSIEIGKAAITACKENGIKSVVITAWGDNGGEASSFSILPALYADAQLNYTGSLEKEKFQIITGMTFDDFMLIDLPCRFSEDPTVHSNASKYLLYNDVFLGIFDSVIPEGIAEYYQSSAMQLKKCCDHATYGYLFDTQAKLCEILQHKADLGVRMKYFYDQKDRIKLSKIADEELPEITNKIHDFYQAFETQWEKENKPFGFEVQCIRIGGLEKRLEYIRKQLKVYLAGKKECIEELEAQRKEFNYYEKNDISQLNWNLWHEIVSPADVG